MIVSVVEVRCDIPAVYRRAINKSEVGTLNMDSLFLEYIKLTMSASRDCAALCSPALYTASRVCSGVRATLACGSFVASSLLPL